jgi:hypothetical protein
VSCRDALPPDGKNQQLSWLVVIGQMWYRGSQFVTKCLHRKFVVKESSFEELVSQFDRDAWLSIRLIVSALKIQFWTTFAKARLV